MRVGIDARSLRAGPAGVASYVRALLRHIPCLEGVDRLFPANNLLWNCLWGPWFQVRRRWSVFHAPGYTAPLLNVSKVVLSVHDVSYLANADWYPYRLTKGRLAYYRASIRRADRILVPSAFSFDELVQRFPDVRTKVRRVPLGVGEDYFPDSEAGKKAVDNFGLPERFLLHVGDLHPRRNIALLAEVARQAGMPLVLVGRPLTGAVPSGNDIFHLSSLPQDLLRGLYSVARAFVYASSYEGFGLPLVEAMACGLPVVAAKGSCIAEVCSDAAVLVEPAVESFADGLRQVWEQRREYTLRGLERARSLSWAETARQTMAVYQELV